VELDAHNPLDDVSIEDSYPEDLIFFILNPCSEGFFLQRSYKETSLIILKL